MESGSQGSTAPSAAPADRDLVERRKVIKNKILAVGRMAHFFSLLRCVASLHLSSTYCTHCTTARSRSGYRSSRVSRVRQDCHTARSRSAPKESRTPSRRSMTRTPCTPLSFLCQHKLTFMNRRKSDIENERLPPIDERQPPPASSNAIPGASANLGQSVSASAAPRANAVAPPPVTTFKRPKDGKTQRR